MKVSLAWIFDHIDVDWKKQDPLTKLVFHEIVSKFNQITAEIESVKKVKIDLSNLHPFGSEEVGKTNLPERPLKAGEYFLVYKKDKELRWATCRDVGLDKEGLLPAFEMSDKEAGGAWRKLFESEDVILDVDNKSLTHRPDMWGHRGFAREIAAFLELPLKKKETLLSAHGISGKNKNFSLKIESDACKRFAGLHFNSIENKVSNIFVASRLIKAGVRPINGIVDLTNYVMLDWSQPLHAYDAEKIEKNRLVARQAKKKEKLELLDGETIELTPEDLVIADGKKAVGLAGVMGGMSDSIGVNTKSIFLESAAFQAVGIRRTAFRHGIRTDASTRFEKTLDPNQITDAILRFVELTKQFGIKINISEDVIVVGEPFKEKTIGVTHSFLEGRSGVELEKKNVLEPLTRLGFTVLDSQETIGEKEDVLYTITIPSFRGAKDVEIKEDILEEVIRCFGFNKIGLELPKITKRPGDLTQLFKERDLKKFLVRSAGMTEQRNYIYNDEAFLAELGLKFDHLVSIKNPVSENNVDLVPSLIPNLCRNVKHNCVNVTGLRFFEFGRVFSLMKDEVIEEKRASAIFFEKRGNLDFYDCKETLLKFFSVAGFQDPKKIVWKKIEEKRKNSPWVMPYQSAELFYENSFLGIAGKVEKTFLSKLGDLEHADAFFFELSLDKLMLHERDAIAYTPVSKFQEVTFDLSFAIPIRLKVDNLESALFDSDDLITKTTLIDFFDKKEWVYKRSVAFRLWVNHPDKTLLKSEIELVRDNAIKSVEKLGGELR